MTVVTWQDDVDTARCALTAALGENGLQAMPHIEAAVAALQMALKRIAMDAVVLRHSEAEEKP